MANFSDWVKKGTKRHGKIYGSPPNYRTYQDLTNDSGNWSTGKKGRGVLIGTNRSIAAPTLIAWRKRMVTKAEMEALSAEEATAIYKVKYWDAIKGDQIKNQIIANFLADMKSSAGGNAAKAMHRALNARGENIATSTEIKDATVQAINRQISKNVKALYRAFHGEMTAHYKAGDPAFRTQWLRSMNKYYPIDRNDFISEEDKSATKWIWILVGCGVLVVVGAMAYFLSKQ